MTNTTNIQPIGNRVLVKRIDETEQKKGSIYIPDTAKEKPQEAIVIAVGTQNYDKHGNNIPFVVAPGDKVFITKYAGTPVKFEDEEYLILSSNEIMAIITK